MMMVFWDVTPCSVMFRYQEYGVLECDTVFFGM
jgi:hypothetical protein